MCKLKQMLLFLMIGALMSACSEPQLAERQLVNAILAGKNADGWQLVCLCGTDPQNAEPICGKGTSPAAAFADFEAETAGRAYYGVVQRIFCDKALSRSDLDLFARQLIHRAGFLPNIELFAVDSFSGAEHDLSQLLFCRTAGAAPFLGAVGEQDLPLPCADAKEPAVVLFQSRHNTRLQGASAAAALVLAGNTREVAFESAHKERVVWKQATARLTACQTDRGTELLLTLYGTLRADKADRNEAVSDLTGAACRLIAQTALQKNSCFGVKAALAAWNSTLPPRFYGSETPVCTVKTISQMIVLK